MALMLPDELTQKPRTPGLPPLPGTPGAAPVEPMGATDLGGAGQITSYAENFNPGAYTPPRTTSPGATDLGDTGIMTTSAENMAPVTFPRRPGLPLQPGLPDLSQFSPERNLIGSEIRPGTDPRQARTQGYSDTALESLFSGPNREDIAAKTLQNLDERQANARKLGIQDIGRGAARLGRLGSGVVTTSLGDLETELGAERERTLRDLSAETADKELGDRLARFGAASGQERDLFGRGVTSREELRGERGYQQDLEQQAINNAIQQFLLEQGAQQQGFGQERDINQLLGGYGYGPSSNVPLDVASRRAGEGSASAEALAQLLFQLGQKG